jgi:hypothetical protein
MFQPPLPPPTPQHQLHYICYRAPAAPTLDGRIDKPFWEGAPWTDAFVDIEGDAKPKPHLRTRAKLLWDDQCLYVAAELEEPHIWATLTEHDSIVFHDNDFEVFLNPTGDNHRYYEIEVNALNTIFDLYLPKPYRDGGPADHGWDVKGLRSAVRIDGTLNDPRDIDRRWTVEMAFPWAAFDRHDAIKCPPKDGDQWRLNFSRVQWDLDVIDGGYRKVAGHPEHNWVWSPQGVIDMHRPEQWGYLQFAGVVSGPVEYAPDPTAGSRGVLHSVYYAQLAFRAKNGRWAATLAELGTSPEGVRLDATPSGWTATVSSGSREVSIREDSLVTVRTDR